MQTSIVGAVLAALMAGSAPAAGQSLAEVARKEQARREAMRSAGKTYTNADLTPDITPVPISAEPSRHEGASDAAGTDASEPVPAVVESATDAPTTAEPLRPGGIDEAGWRRRGEGLMNRVAIAEKALAEVSGPSEGNERQRARMTELRLKYEAALGRAQAALAAFEREAEAAGVPPAWRR